jgi:phosphoribosylamine--glycine ligase
MLVAGDPFVIEFNCRFGDPETQVVLPRLASDLVDLFESVAMGTLGRVTVEIDDRACCTVVLAAGGYPETYQKGFVISGLETISNALVFHAGTAVDDRGHVVTAGGRVLAVSAYGHSLETARSQALHAAGQIEFEAKYYRSDIGVEVL